MANGNDEQGFKGRNLTTREGGTLVQKQEQDAVTKANAASASKASKASKASDAKDGE